MNNSKRKYFILLAAIQSTLIFTIALIMIPLPKIAAEFSMSSSQMLLLQTAYGLPFSALLLFGGRLTDRFGGKPMLFIGLVGFGVSSVVAAISPNYYVLVGMRLLQGLMGALIAPAAVSVLRTLFTDDEEFGRAMATWGGVSVLGAILGFISSGIITNWISWRWMFLFPVLVSLVSLGFYRALPRDSNEQHSRNELDIFGALAVSAAIILVNFGLINSHEFSWSAVKVWGPFVSGTVLVLVFTIIESKVKNPLLPLNFTQSSSRIMGWFGMFLAAAGSVLIEYILLIYLQEVRQWSPLMTAASFLPFAITLLLSNTYAPSVVARFGAKVTTLGGFFIAAIGLFILASLSAESEYLFVLLPGQVLLSVGASAIFSGAAVLSTDEVPLSEMGLAGGMMNTMMEMGPTFGLSVLMAIAATQGEKVKGFAWAFGILGGTYFTIALMLTLVGTKRTSKKGELK